MTEERVAAAWARLKELGFSRLEPSYSCDVSEPLLGYEAREVVYKLIGKLGRFRTVQGVASYNLASWLDLDGFLVEGEDQDELSDALDPEYQYVVLPPIGYTGETEAYLVVEYDQTDNKQGDNPT